MINVQGKMERTRYKSQTLILKNDFNSQNYNYVPQRIVDDKQVVRYTNDNGNEIHTPQQQELSKLNRRETFQLDSEQKQNNLSHNNGIQKLITPMLHSQIPIKKMISSNQTPVGSSQNININVLKKQSTISNIFQAAQKGFQFQSAHILDQKDNSPIRNTKNIFFRGSENIIRSSEVFSPDKTAFPSLNKSGLIKQTGLPLVQNHNNNFNNINNINNSQNLSKSNIFNSTINNNNNVLVRLPTRSNTRSIAQFPLGNAQIRATSMNFNPTHFMIQKTSTNFNPQAIGSNSQISPMIGPSSPIKLDLRETLKPSIRKSMNDFSPIRNQTIADGNLFDSKVDNYISLRHSSLVHIDDEAKSPIGNGNQKKIIPIQTSNALLPQSVVNQMKIQKSPGSRQPQRQDPLLSPPSNLFFFHQKQYFQIQINLLNMYVTLLNLDQCKIFLIKCYQIKQSNIKFFI